MKDLAALLGGIIFGAGLVVSGMTNPDKVLAFLTLGAGWDISLIFVMGSALVVAAIGYAVFGRRAAPLFEADYSMPTNKLIDKPLVGGAALFGLGWGVAGFCPGPALVGLLTLDLRAVVFVLAYVGGVLLYERLAEKLTALDATPQASTDG